MKKVKNALKYIVVLGLSSYFLYYVFKDFSLEEFKTGVKNANYNLIGIALIMNLLNHFVRSIRWKYILISWGHRIPIYKMFVSEMSGFFANLFVPRIGEIVRCKVLQNMTSTPISTSFVTVLVERLFDALSFFLILFVAVISLGKTITGGLEHLNIDIFRYIKLGIIAGCVLLSAIVLFFFFFRSYYKKLKTLVVEFILKTIHDLKSLLRSKYLILVIILTFVVWVFYYLAGYFCLISISKTSHLGIAAGISIFITSNLGMATPVQGGGAGAFHLLVIASLKIFGIDDGTAILYATLFHGLQFFTAFLFGGLSMITSFFVRE